MQVFLPEILLKLPRSGTNYLVEIMGLFRPMPSQGYMVATTNLMSQMWGQNKSHKVNKLLLSVIEKDRYFGVHLVNFDFVAQYFVYFTYLSEINLSGFQSDFRLEKDKRLFSRSRFPNNKEHHKFFNSSTNLNQSSNGPACARTLLKGIALFALPRVHQIRNQ